MAAGAEVLPFIDRHSVEVAASPEATWSALESTLVRSLDSDSSSLAARVLGCIDTAGTGGKPLSEGSTVPGFRVLIFQPSRELVLTGRHRFARYEMVFGLASVGTDETELTIDTRAAFPGLKGSLYRFLVIGTRAHVLVTRRLLFAVKRDAEG